MECAHLRGSSSFLKPNPYVELSIDDKCPRKTEIVKNTYQPKWNEEIEVLVTPRSMLSFRVIDHNSFRKDATLGEKKFNLYQILTHYNGKCENLEVTLDLMSDSKHDMQPVKVGELIALLNGLRLDMSVLSVTRTSTNGAAQNVMPLGPACTANSDAGVGGNTTAVGRSVLNNGVKVRMRLHGSENVVPSLAQAADGRRPCSMPPITNGAAVALGPPPLGPPSLVNGGPLGSPENHRTPNPVPEEPLPPGWEMR